MSDRHTILLGAATPLYAPLYLAKQLSPDIYKYIDFEYARGAAGTHHSTFYDDPLVSDVLDKSARKRRFIMAVGDPFRALFTTRTKVSYTPYILGTLIKNMCFWLLDDSPRPLVDKDIPADVYNHFQAIVSHPQYMTGYSVLYHYLTSLEPNSAHVADERIWADAVPDLEPKYYKHYTNRYRGKMRRSTHYPQGGPRFAYITTNMMHINERLHTEGDRFTVLEFATMRDFENTMMTGLIVGKEFYQTQETTLCDDLIGGFGQALHVLENDPEQGAYYLSKYTGDVNANFRWGWAELLNRFRGYNIFSEGTIITDRDIKKGWEVRKAMRAFQEANGAHPLQLTDASSYEKYFRIGHTSPPPASNARWAVEPLRLVTMDKVSLESSYRWTSCLTSLSSFVILAFLNVTAVHYEKYFSVIFNGAHKVWIFWGLLVFALIISARQILDILLFFRHPVSEGQNKQAAEPLVSRLLTSINIGLVVAPIAWKLAEYIGEPTGMVIYVGSLIFSAFLAKGVSVPQGEIGGKMRRWRRSACLRWEDGVLKWRFALEKNRRFKENPTMGCQTGSRTSSEL